MHYDTGCLDLGLDPGVSQPKRLCFLAQQLMCLRKDFGGLCEYNRVVPKVKISDPDCFEGDYAAPHFGKCWGKNTSLAHPFINLEVVRIDAITAHSTLCTRIQAGYQFVEL